MPVVTSGSLTTGCDSTPPPPLHHLGQTISSSNSGLVEVMAVLNRSMSNQHAVLQETLRQLQSASKEHFLSNAKPCDGKNLQEFGIWLDEVSRLATICNKNPIEVALAISKGKLHKYISKLVSSRVSWLPIKAHLQERFLECSSATMAKHNLTQLKQAELPMHEYITKFSDMAEHAYSIKVTDSASVILASNFIKGVQNSRIKNKLRSYQIKNLKDVFGHATQEDQKQKIRALDFGVATFSETTTKTNCSINVTRYKGCFECKSGHRWHTADCYHRREKPNKDHHYRSSLRHNSHQWGYKDGHINNTSRSPHA